MDGINAWWKGIPGERFWLGIAARDDKGEVLAAPCGAGRNTYCSEHRLITHVRDGDAVFHFDDAQQCIVAWSTSRGRVQKTRRIWTWRGEGLAPEEDAPRPLPGWTIGLERPTPLDRVVHLDQIARTQWALVPELRAFEDEVGEPLYYPFAMGSPYGTRLLSGYVFKLPALFVESVPSLAQVAKDMTWYAPARAADGPGTGAARVAAPRAPWTVPPPADASALLAR